MALQEFPPAFGSFRNFFTGSATLEATAFLPLFGLRGGKLGAIIVPLRTNFFAFTARLTFVRVDVCQIVLQRNCLERTYFHTLATADTGYGTGLTGYSTLILVYALHINAAGFLCLADGFR